MQQTQQNEGTSLFLDGRIIWGSLEYKEAIDYITKGKKINHKTGEVVMETSFGLAVPKIGANSSQAAKENFTKLWNALINEAAKMGVQWGNKAFHWKVVDGDVDLKKDGTKYGKHYEGCFVLSCSTRGTVDTYKSVADPMTGVPTYMQLAPTEIVAGDYVRVALTIKSHGDPNAGLYINPNLVALMQKGERIVSENRPSPNQMFGNTKFAVDNTIVPQAPIGAPAMQQQYQQPVAPQVPTMQQAPVVPQAPQMGQPVEPNYGVLPPAMQQQYTQPSAQPVVPQMPQMPQMPQG